MNEWTYFLVKEVRHEWLTGFDLIYVKFKTDKSNPYS